MAGAAAHSPPGPKPTARSGATVTGDDTRIRLNRSFVTKALRFGFTSFELTDEVSPILFTAPGRKLVAMPIRMGTTPSTQPTPQPEAEAVAPAPPSAEAPEETPTEERTTMPAETNITPLRRGKLQPKAEPANGNGNGTNGSALAAAITQVEAAKTVLRELLAGLNTAQDLLRAAEREKKASAKEVESVRATLRTLQKVAI